MQETGNSCTGFSKTVQKKDIPAHTQIIGSRELFQRQFPIVNNFYKPFSKNYNFSKLNKGFYKEIKPSFSKAKRKTSFGL